MSLECPVQGSLSERSKRLRSIGIDNEDWQLAYILLDPPRSHDLTHGASTPLNSLSLHQIMLM